MENGDHRQDILRQIHSYLIHSMETTKLRRNERMEIEEELKAMDDDCDDEQREEERMKLVTERMRQKSLRMKEIVGDAVNTKFVTETEINESKTELINEVPTVCNDDMFLSDLSIFKVKVFVSHFVA